MRDIDSSTEVKVKRKMRALEEAISQIRGLKGAACSIILTILPLLLAHDEESGCYGRPLMRQYIKGRY